MKCKTLFLKSIDLNLILITFRDFTFSPSVHCLLHDCRFKFNQRLLLIALKAQRQSANYLHIHTVKEREREIGAIEFHKSNNSSSRPKGCNFRPVAPFSMSIGEDYSPHRRRRFYCLGKSLSLSFIIDSLSNSVFVSFAFFMTKASLSSLVLLSLLLCSERDCPCEMRLLPKAISPLRWPFSSRWPFYICPYYLIMPLKAQAPVIRCCCC